MKSPISLSLFFPAYNEVENLRQSVEEALTYLASEPRISKYEVLIVNDGSSDGMDALADTLAETYPEVRSIHHRVNEGYGAALHSGISAAQYDYIFFTDTDLQFDITELPRLLDHVPEYEFVSGYRAPRRDPAMRLLNAWVWNKLNRVFFGLKSKDIDCAFKLFRRDIVQNMPIRSRGAMISAEILTRASRRGIAIKEVPVTHLPRVAGSPTGAKLSVIFRALQEMYALYQTDLGRPALVQVLKYMVVGVINTLVDVLAYIVLTRVVHLDSITVAKLLSFLTGSISSFVLNRFWTFKLRTRLRIREFLRFYGSIAVSLVINLAVMAFLTNVLHIYDLIALAITTVFTFGISFTLARAWVFIAHVQEHIPHVPSPAPTTNI